MNRWSWFWICGILGLAMLFCGLLVPAHLRAVDDSIIEKAGRNTPSLVEHGLGLVKAKQSGAARLLLQAAQAEKIAGQGTLHQAVITLEQQQPELRIWGAAEPGLETLIDSNSTNNGEPFTEVVIRLEIRERALELLNASTRPGVQELLRFRSVTNTVLFPPSSSAQGQALDAALIIGGLLFETGHLSAGLSNAVFALASTAVRGGNSQPFEQVLMDLMSLGQRLNWGQLAAFVGRIEQVETLRQLANLARQGDGQVPALFAAVELSGQPAAVAGYLMNFSKTGRHDLGASFRYGTGGLEELLRRNQPLHASSFRWHLGLNSCLRTPAFALTVKWVFYVLSGFLLAMALHFARPAVAVLERPLQVRGVHLAREFLFALGFLLVVLLLSEPFLAQDSQKAEFRFQLRLPMAGSTVPAGKPGVNPPFMNNANILTMLLFFVLQGLLYAACLVKLAEIRRQKVPARIKVRLLENEDHLFDAGLYLGFLGTIISFILSSVSQALHFNLMVAYSSTSFGILFVSIFKIFHLRPARRKLLLEAEVGSAEPPPVPHTAPPSYAAPL